MKPSFDSSISSIYQLFEEQAKKYPNRIALKCSEQTFTYKLLQEKVEKLAGELAFNYGVEKGHRVAIALPVSVDFIVTTLACLRCGAPYIPLNIDYPEAYLESILKDAQVVFLLTNRPTKDKPAVSKRKAVCVDEIKSVGALSPYPAFNLDDEAYIIYTSGSTGLPKGVVISQKNIINLMFATQTIYHINCDDVIPLFHSVSFDFSVWEIYSALLNGACLTIPSDEVKKSTEDYFEYLIENDITIANFTPSVFYLLINAIKRKPISQLKLRLIILGGEAFYAQKAKNWFNLPIANHAKIYNMYGITEGTIHVTSSEINYEMTQSSRSIIGQALPGTKTAIIKGNENLSFSHGEGELCIGGFAVAKEYLNHKELTEEKFFEVDGERWFRTGDLVQQTDNNLIYLGRLDNLVKIRGFRINCAEIEGVLLEQLGVNNVAVVPYTLQGEDERLVAFLEANPNEIKISEIMLRLQEALPNFMMPSKIIVVEQFPLTINGKIDLSKLFECLIVAPSRLTENSIEQKIIAAWEKVLGHNNFKTTENFFEVGGDSLLLIKLQFFLRETLEKNIQVVDLIRYPSIKSFCDFIQSKE